MDEGVCEGQRGRRNAPRGITDAAGRLNLCRKIVFHLLYWICCCFFFLDSDTHGFFFLSEFKQTDENGDHPFFFTELSRTD